MVWWEILVFMSVLTCLTFYVWCTALSCIFSPNSACFPTKMQLLVFIFGVYKSPYWMNDLLLFMQIMF